MNPDRKIIVSSHIHIYENRYAKKDTVAIPLEESNFPNTSTQKDVF
ncbi:DUF6978 family protein [Aerococcus tenax]